MSAVFTSLFKATAGLLVKKAHQKAVEKLSNGDATDEAFRKLIEDELGQIGKHIQGFTDSIFSSGVDFLKEGVVKLNRVTETALVHEDDGKVRSHKAARTSQKSAGYCVTDGPAAYATAAIKEMKLTNLSDSAQKLLRDAKDRFRSARIKATEAFNNQALPTDKRILALKIRLMASVLECVDRPEHAVDDCHRCLELLHEMKAVRENFKVQLYGGFKAPFEKKQREEIVFAVCQMNYVVFRIIQVINGGNGEEITLPTLEVNREHIDVLRDERAIRKLVDLEMAEFCRGVWALGKEGKNEQRLGQPYRVACNLLGQFIVADAGSNSPGIKVYSSGGKPLYFSKVNSMPVVHSMATDEHNNVYVLADAGDANLGARAVYVFSQFASARRKRTSFVGGDAALCKSDTISLGDDFLGISLAVGPKHQLFVLGGTLSGNTSYVAVHDINGGGVVQELGRRVLKKPKDIAVAENGQVFVLTIPDAPVVQTFSAKGKNLQSFRLRGSWCTEGSIGVCRDSRSLVVSLWGKNCPKNENLLIYSVEGDTVSEMRVPSEKGQRNTVQDVAVTVDGRVAVITSTPAGSSCCIFTV